MSKKLELILVPTDFSGLSCEAFSWAALLTKKFKAKIVIVHICGNILTIRGEKKHVKEDKTENHYLGDRYYGSFRRTFQLPADIDPDKAEASFAKGVLKISVPKVEEGQTKKIEIHGN